MSEEKFQSIYGDTEDEFDVEDVSDETTSISKEEIEEAISEEPVPSTEEEAPVQETHEEEPVVPEEPKEEPKKKTGLIIAGAVIGVLAVAYIGASVYFKDRFQFRTTVDGTDVSLQTAAQVAETLQSSVTGYTLNLTGRNGVTDTITADEIGLTLEPEAELTSLIGQRSMFAWPLSLFSETNYTTTTEAEFDETRLESTIASLAFYDEANVIEPTDASYQLVDGSYEVVAEDDGALLDDNKTISAIALAIANGETTLDLDAAGCYQSAAVKTTDEALSADVSTLNQFINMEIHIPIGGGDGEDIDAATIATWIVADDSLIEGMAAAGDDTDDAAAAAANAMADGSGASGLPEGYTFDTDKIAEYVSGLAEKYNTYGTTHSFKTQGGSTYTTSVGNYGWWLNQKSTAAAILTALNSGAGGEVTPVYIQKANQWPTEENGNDDIGDTYAEVDLDNQHVYVVKNGSLVLEMDCVSGKPTSDRITPDGIYRITFKQLDATLKGEDYETPVKYWMPFNQGIGFHDADWRSYFGGKIYVTNGSHGCINLPPSKAAQLYDYVYTGMPVIVYGGMTVSEASEFTSKNGSQAGTGTSTASGEAVERKEESSTAASSEAAGSDNAGSNSDASAATSEDTSAQDAANAAAATQQVHDAANQIAQQIYQQQIAAGASEAEALAAAQAAANAAISAAGQ